MQSLAVFWEIALDSFVARDFTTKMKQRGISPSAVSMSIGAFKTKH
jgi:hypothetical protein